MRNSWVIAWREFVQSVCTKGFFIGLIIAPAMMALSIFIPRFLEDVKEEGERHLAVVDLTGKVYEPLLAAADALNAADVEGTKFVLSQVPAPVSPSGELASELSWEQWQSLKSELAVKVRKGEVFGFVIVGAKILNLDLPEDYYDEPDDEEQEAYRDWESSTWHYTVTYGAESLTDLKTSRFITSSLGRIVRQERYLSTGIDQSLVSKVTRAVKVQEFRVQKTKKKTSDQPGSGVVKTSGKKEMALPIGFMIMLYLSIMTSAGPLLNNTVEEKSNRILEVLLSASTPLQILSGKIFGNYLMGLLVTVIWGAAGLAAAAYHGLLDSGSFSMDSLLYFVFFFLSGYLLYGCIYAAIGSVCMTIQEAQSMMTPAILLMFLPLIAIGHVIENPGSTISVFLSCFPFTAPFFMMLRLGLSPEPALWQVLLSMASMVVGVVFLLWASAKVFQIAILLYGKPPSMKQLWKWVMG